MSYPCDKWLCTPAWENSNTKEKLTLKRLRLFRMPASVEDIHRIQEQFPGLAGMMIGRGLLANPALALEYRQNRALEFDEMREKLQSMHKCVYNQYAEQLEGGDEQLLNKMKTFWEYLMPQADRKLLKAIHKSTSLNKYNQAILAFFNQR